MRLLHAFTFGDLLCAESRKSIGKKSTLRHRSKSRSPFTSQSIIPGKAAKGSVIRLHKQSPSRVPIGRQRFDKGHKTKFKLSPPFLLRKIRNRVALTIQKPQDAAPSLEVHANVRNTLASRLKDCQDQAQGADSPRSAQATGPELRVQQPAATATEGPQSPERTASPTGPPRKLRIDIPGMPSPSSASRSSQDHCQPLDIIAPRSQPPPEPSYKIPALKLPMTASQTWQVDHIPELLTKALSQTTTLNWDCDSQFTFKYSIMTHSAYPKLLILHTDFPAKVALFKLLGGLQQWRRMAKRTAVDALSSSNCSSRISVVHAACEKGRTKAIADLLLGLLQEFCIIAYMRQ